MYYFINNVITNILEMAKEMLTVIHFLLDLTVMQTILWDLVVIMDEEHMAVLPV